ncbi:MAG: hypothetical protein HRT61_05910 [Ekhidna sp.]|nr:hypothetical protein [Ekhidna sp.]
MLYKLLIDFGLVILIWMTQLVVYPSFTYFSESDLVNWHSRYTTAISIIVMPLMLAQVAIHGGGLISDFTWLKVAVVVFIGLAWVNTFFFAVPLHSQIDMGRSVNEAAHSLVRVNWYRTVLWSLVFLAGLVEYLRSQ